MTLVALDSTIVMIAAGAPTKLPRGVERVRQLAEYHEKRGDPIMIPAPAFAECCHVDDPLIRMLRIQTFNAAAARLANELKPVLLDLTEGDRNLEKVVTRKQVCVDALILASAEISGAGIIYTTDKWFKKAATEAGLKIKVMEPPEPNASQMILIKNR